MYTKSAFRNAATVVVPLLLPLPVVPLELLVQDGMRSPSPPHGWMKTGDETGQKLRSSTNATSTSSTFLVVVYEYKSFLLGST